MRDEERAPTPAVENRWWVDTGKSPARTRAAADPRSPIGSRFFDMGYEFDQARAKTRLTDQNLKLLDEARPERGGWATLQLVPKESVPAAEIQRIKRALPLPPDARGVIVDSGRSVRFILTGEPVGERVLEFTLGEESSFDCWIRGEWVREELFDDLETALRDAEVFLARYLTSERDTW